MRFSATVMAGLIPAGFVLGLVAAQTVQAASQHLITQTNRTFSARRLAVERGDVIRFTNDDEFIHHVYVKSDTFEFDSGEQEIGRTVEVPFGRAGTFDVRCAIHPKMLLVVTVK